MIMCTTNLMFKIFFIVIKCTLNKINLYNLIVCAITNQAQLKYLDLDFVVGKGHTNNPPI